MIWGSTFSGVGGMDLGLERAGHRIVFQAEVDAFRRDVLSRHWPDSQIFDDVRKVTHGAVDHPSIDGLCGGFPCQDLSVAGNRAGLAGERSGLFFEFARIADDLVRPGGWILIENVRGLFSSNEGADFCTVLGTLADLGFLDGAWRMLDSRYFGVPQRRQRVFILARRSRGECASQVLLEPESGYGDFEASRAEGAKTARHSGPSVEATGATQALTTRFGRTGADLPDAEAGWLVPGSSVLGEPAGGSDRDQLCPSADDRGWKARAGLPGSTDWAEGAPIVSDRGREAAGISGRLDGDEAQAVLACAVDPKPDGRRYAAVGDAVTVNVAEWIGRRLVEYAT